MPGRPDRRLPPANRQVSKVEEEEKKPLYRLPHSFPFALLEKAGVGVAPGVDFEQAGKRAVRFSYTSSEDNIREAARRLYLPGSG